MGLEANIERLRAERVLRDPNTRFSAKDAEDCERLFDLILAATGSQDKAEKAVARFVLKNSGNSDE